MVDKRISDTFPGAIIESLNEALESLLQKHLTSKQINRKWRSLEKKDLINLSDYAGLSYQDQAKKIISLFDQKWLEDINWAVYTEDDILKTISLIILREDVDGETLRHEFHPEYNSLFIKMPAMIESCKTRLIITNKESFTEDNPWHIESDWNDQDDDDQDDLDDLELMTKIIKDHYNKKEA